jgi:CarD family transcriptional regulator
MYLKIKKNGAESKISLNISVKNQEREIKNLNMPRKKTKKKKVKKYLKQKLKKKIYRKKVKTSQTDKNNPERGNVLRISKNYDQKIEIEKIKKQATEKKIFKIKDYVVYPKHGVGQIFSVGTKTIGGIEVHCYEIKFTKDKAVGLLPINKQSHLRPLSSINQINKVISILKGKPKVKRTMWSRRAQEYEQKIVSGKIYDLAEVVRDLNKGNDTLVEQSYSERQLLEKAYDRILNEFQIVLGISHELTQKKLDKALRRI